MTKIKIQSSGTNKLINSNNIGFVAVAVLLAYATFNAGAMCVAFLIVDLCRKKKKKRKIGNDWRWNGKNSNFEEFSSRSEIYLVPERRTFDGSLGNFYMQKKREYGCVEVHRDNESTVNSNSNIIRVIPAVENNNMGMPAQLNCMFDEKLSERVRRAKTQLPRVVANQESLDLDLISTYENR